MKGVRRVKKSNTESELKITPEEYTRKLLTVVETVTFQSLWPRYWTEEERAEFAAHLAAHPDDGELVKESGGCRKIRWGRAGSGKSSGVRVIYFLRSARGEIVLLIIYAKAALDTLQAKTLKGLRDAAEKTAE